MNPFFKVEEHVPEMILWSRDGWNESKTLSNSTVDVYYEALLTIPMRNLVNSISPEIAKL